MAVSIVGTPQLVSGGGTYTAEAGSNRVVVIALAREPTATSTDHTVSTLALGSNSLANGKVISAKETLQTGAVARIRAGVWYIKEADIQAGAQTLTVTWSIAMAGAADLFTCYTLAGVDQATPLDGAGASLNTAGVGTDPWSGTIAVAAGTVQILSAGVNGANSSTPHASWTETRDTSDTAYRVVAHHIASASADAALPWSLDFTGTNTGVVAVASFAPTSVVAPSFTVAPTVTSQTSAAYTVGYTPNLGGDANATFYLAAVPAGAANPSIAQVKAGAGGGIVNATSEVVTGADTTVLTITGTIFPKYKLCWVLSNSAGDTALGTSDNEFLDPPAGKQFQVLASVSGTSPLTGETPTIVAGDIWVLDLLSTPNSFAITPTDTGDYTMDRGGDTSRQSFAHDVYDDSLKAYYGAGTVYDGNQAPNFIGGGPAFFNSAIYQKSVNQGTIALSVAWDDAEGDTRTFAVQSGALPTGWSMAANGDITGTPSAYGTFNFTTRVTDSPPGDYTDLADAVLIGDAAPDVVGQAEATAITNIEAIASFTVNEPVEEAYSASVPEGDVISQFPEADEVVAEDTAFTLTVSLGQSPASGAGVCHGFGFGFSLL